jgi:hypothetical protein
MLQRTRLPHYSGTHAVAEAAPLGSISLAQACHTGEVFLQREAFRDRRHNTPNEGETMSKLLQLSASSSSADRQSSRLMDEYVADWRARNPDGTVIVRNFTGDTMPHMTAERRTAQNTGVALSDRLIDELRQADVIVLGMPTCKLVGPSMLAACLDHFGRAGVTFRYMLEGFEGLLSGEKDNGICRALQ